MAGCVLWTRLHQGAHHGRRAWKAANLNPPHPRLAQHLLRQIAGPLVSSIITQYGYVPTYPATLPQNSPHSPPHPPLRACHRPSAAGLHLPVKEAASHARVQVLVRRACNRIHTRQTGKGREHKKESVCTAHTSQLCHAASQRTAPESARGFRPCRVPSRSRWPVCSHTQPASSRHQAVRAPACPVSTVDRRPTPCSPKSDGIINSKPQEMSHAHGSRNAIQLR